MTDEEYEKAVSARYPSLTPEGIRAAARHLRCIDPTPRFPEEVEILIFVKSKETYGLDVQHDFMARR